MKDKDGDEAVFLCLRCLCAIFIATTYILELYSYSFTVYVHSPRRSVTASSNFNIHIVRFVVLLLLFDSLYSLEYAVWLRIFPRGLD